MGMEKQAGREGPCCGGHQWRKEFIPQRHIIVAAERLRKDERSRYWGTKQCPDGTGGSQNRPVQRANAREKTCSQKDCQRDINRHNGMFRPEAYAARKTDNQRDNKPRQSRGRYWRTNQGFQCRVRPGMARAIADHQTYGNSGQGQHHHDPPWRVSADAKFNRQRGP